MKKFSIIVPVYNAEDSLKEFFDTILNTERDFELIMVDNQSTDNSLKYIKQRAKADARIKVLMQTKEGPSATRRKGFLRASGDYILFVDGDDIILPSALDTYEQIFEETKTDMIISNYIERYKGSEHIKKGISSLLKDFDNLKDTPEVLLVKPSLGNKCFKRSLIDKDDFVDAWLAEDMVVTLNAIKRANKIVYNNSEVYYYNLNDGGLSQNVNPDRLITILRSLKKIEELFKDEYCEERNFIIYSHLLYRMFRIVLVTNDKKREEVYDKMLRYINKIDIKDNKYYRINKAMKLASFVILKKKVYNNFIIKFLLKKMQTNAFIFKLIKKFDK